MAVLLHSPRVALQLCMNWLLPFSHLLQIVVIDNCHLPMSQPACELFRLVDYVERIVLLGA